MRCRPGGLPGASGWSSSSSLAVVALRRSARNQVLPVLVWWTIGYWLVRGGGIVLDANHDASFKVVHSVLMVISIGTAMWVWRAQVASLRDAMGQPVTLIDVVAPSGHPPLRAESQSHRDGPRPLRDG